MRHTVIAILDAAAICMREVARRPADAATDIENPAVLRRCNPHGLIAGGGRAARVKMLDGGKDFRSEVLRIMSRFSECGVNPRKHTSPRPMRLNIHRQFDPAAEDLV